MGIVVTFLMPLVFSILLPSGDQVSDLVFWYNTVNFLGNGETLFGCRACYEKNRIGHDEVVGETCKICLSSKKRAFSDFQGLRINESEFLNTSETFYQFNYGSDPCKLIIKNKALELESADKACERRSFREILDEANIGYGNKLDIIEGECQSSDVCCMERKLLNASDEEYNIENYLGFERCIRNNQGCELCIGTRKLGKSCLYLIDITDPFYNQSTPYHPISYPWHIKDRKCSEFVESEHYSINNITLENEQLFSVDYKKGTCHHDDQCCLRLRNVEENFTEGFKVKHCYDSVCSQHLEVKIKRYLDKGITEQEWREMDIYAHGKNLGGRLCSTLENFGYAVIVPIMMNMLFGVWQWTKDLRQDDALYLEVIFALINFYPQYKITKLLIRYAFGFISDKKLNDYKRRFDGELASIEPFVESVWQVCIKSKYESAFYIQKKYLKQ